MVAHVVTGPWILQGVGPCSMGSWIAALEAGRCGPVDDSYDDAGRAATHTVLPRRLADGGLTWLTSQRCGLRSEIASAG